MENFPTAEEAFAETNRNIEHGVSQQLEELQAQIKQAISNQKFFINGEGMLDARVIYWLRKNNYKVTAGSQYNRSYWIIDWDLSKRNDKRL